MVTMMVMTRVVVVTVLIMMVDMLINDYVDGQ